MHHVTYVVPQTYYNTVGYLEIEFILFRINVKLISIFEQLQDEPRLRILNDGYLQKKKKKHVSVTEISWCNNL